MSTIAKVPLNIYAASSDPSTPTLRAGDLYYNTTTGKVRVHTGSAWADVDTAIEVHTFSVPGTLTVQTGKSRIYLEGNYVFETARASVNTANTGATVLVDINKNGTTIYTTQSARPTIAISGNTATGNSPAVTTFASGDYITVDVDQIGSTIAGADLTVTIRLRKVL